MKLAGSSWGANANTLRSSALALRYSVAEYCCPVWQRSTHVSLVDAQLHFSMRLISGAVRSTPLPWLPNNGGPFSQILNHKYWTTSSATQSCHRQVDNAGWMSPWLAIIWWRLLPSSTSPGITQTTVEGLAVNWCHKSVEGRLAIGYGGQFHFSGRPRNPTSRFWSSQTSVVTAESFSDRPGPL